MRAKKSAKKAATLSKFIGGRIRTMRTERSLTQKLFAKKSKIAISYVSMLERGERLPSLDMLASIATTFGVKLQDMVGGF